IALRRQLVRRDERRKLRRPRRAPAMHQQGREIHIDASLRRKLQRLGQPHPNPTNLRHMALRLPPPQIARARKNPQELCKAWLFDVHRVLQPLAHRFRVVTDRRVVRIGPPSSWAHSPPPRVQRVSSLPEAPARPTLAAQTLRLACGYHPSRDRSKPRDSQGREGSRSPPNHPPTMLEAP